MRVYDLAKEYDFTSKEFAQIMKDMGIPVKNHMSALTPQQEKYFRNNFNKEAYLESKNGVDTTKVAKAKEAEKAPVAQEAKQTKEVKEEAAIKEEKKPAVKPVAKNVKPKEEPKVVVSKEKEDTKHIRTKTKKVYNKTNEENPAVGVEDLKQKFNDKKPVVSKKPVVDKKKGAKPAIVPKFIDNSKRATKANKRDYKKKNKELREEKEIKIAEQVKEITLPESITIGDLANKLEKAPTEIIKVLMGYGIMAGVNQVIDFDTISIVCEEFNYMATVEDENEMVDNLLDAHYEDESKLEKRPPIVTVMGHVDHGKTSLLDSIRKTDVIGGEAGGITQHIGAYTISLNNQPITFIDTPGHEAFTAMRSRGASVTDIAILVVAADDGVMPQTIEAINHAKAAEVPIIVAINKIDKPGATPDRVKQELTEHGLVCEDWGGDTICVEISAKQGIGIENLLEMILLVSEVEELKANPCLKAVGTVIEARLDKQRGPTATLLIKSGTLNVSDIVVCNHLYGKVKVMNDDKGNSIKSAGPSYAIEILGFSEVPQAGEKFFVVQSDREARKITDQKRIKLRENALKKNGPVSLDDLFNQISEGQLKEIKLIIKADVQGSFEALRQSLEKLNNNEDGLRVSIIHGGVGAVTESDVVLASASNAIIIAFNVKPEAKALAASMKEEVEIRTYTIIYQVIEEMEKALKGLLDPEFKEVITGIASVRQVFKIPNGGVIAGSYITKGTIGRKDKVRVIRDSIVLFEGDISSLKRFKDDAKEVATGYECGIGIDGYIDLKEEDILEAFKLEEIPRG